MAAVRFLETPVHQASDFISFYEGTGYSHAEHKRLIDGDIHLELDSPPKDLKLLKKSRQFVLYRTVPAGLSRIEAGRARGDQLARPPEAAYALTGRAVCNRRVFNPRLFSVTAGGAGGHYIPLFRSPFGTRIATGGAVYGNAVYAAGGAASWALLTLTVTPTVGAPITFNAQVDRHGDFIMPLDRLPALEKDAPSPTYAAVLSAKASGESDTEIENPDAAAPINVEAFATAGEFAPTVNIALVPGKVVKIFSKDQEHLVLKVPD